MNKKKKLVEVLRKEELKGSVLKKRGEIDTMKQTPDNMKKTGIEKL